MILGLNGPFAGLPGYALLAFQVLSTATSYGTETSDSPTPYSKFAQSASNTIPFPVPSRVGMFFIYAPALVSATYFAPYSTVSALAATHFGKRVLEVLFLHKYSGTVPLPISLFIGSYYAFVSQICCRAFADSDVVHPLQPLGLGLFAIGTLGNLYHHYLLRTLRSTSATTKYVVPSGGLFQYVAAPHYFFELMAWLGIAVVSNHINVFLVFTSMSSYLAGRSVAQNRWNRNKFADLWPASRKNLIPGVW